MTRAAHDESWIRTAPIIEVITYLQARAAAYRGKITPAELAVLAKRLVSLEDEPGGPYKNESGIIDPTLNQAIAALMNNLGSPLPNLAMYNAEPVKARDIETEPLSRIQQRAYDQIVQLPEPLREHSLRSFKRILKADKDREISELSGLFVASMPDLTLQDSDALGAANLFVWTAYSLYDDLIDEDGSAQDIPVANVLHRMAFMAFMKYAKKDAPLVSNCFDTMDAANSWELTHCRFSVFGNTVVIKDLPYYGKLKVLSDRSSAHILGPLLLARRAGFDEATIKAISNALNDYLQARQLNDDLHDWVEDLSLGHISPVVDRLLRTANIKPGHHAITGLTALLRHAFWDSELITISNEALRRIRRAERTLIANGMLRSSPFITQVLRPIRRSLLLGIKRHNDDVRFLGEYSQINPDAT